MKRIMGLVVIGAILLGLFFSIGCSAKTADPIEYRPDKNHSHTVVILFHKTPFKTELVAGIAKGLKAKGVLTITDDLKRANEHSPITADLVVLVVSVWAGQATGDGLDYLKSFKDVSNVMVVSTSGRGSLTGLERYPEFESIEAVTGASSLDSAGAFAEKITHSIERRLGI